MLPANQTADTAIQPFDVWRRLAPRPLVLRDRGMTLLLVVVFVFVAGLRLTVSGVAPVGDPTEGRYAQVADHMAVTGDWVTPQVWVGETHVPFLGKPPLFFWTAALAIDVLGSNEFAARLPSFLAAIVLLVLMFQILATYLDRDTAVLAVLITSTSALFFLLSGAVALDMHLAAFCAGAYLAYLAFALEPNERTKKRWSLLVFILLAGGFLTKGPVALILFGFPVVAWTLHTKRWSLLGKHAWATGLPLFVLIVCPWFMLAEIRNPGFMYYFFINENCLRYLSPHYGDLYGTGHIYPRGSAIVFFVAAALPWSPVGGWMLARDGWRGFKDMMRDDLGSFFFFGFAANVFFWCFARQLLVTYMLPMIPMFASWMAYRLRQTNSLQNTKKIGRLALGAAVVWCALLLTAMPSVSGSSTREILIRAQEVARELGISGEVVFGQRTPQSAYFYAPGKIHAHPKEMVRTTVERTLQIDEPRLFAIRESAVREIPQDLMSVMRPVESTNGWRLFLIHPGISARSDDFAGLQYPR